MSASHTVMRGDTLSKISKTYNIPVTDLRNINQLGNSNIPNIGEEVALSKETVLGLQVLFLDRDRNPIKSLPYRLEFAGKSKSGRSTESGLSTKIVTDTPKDVVRILIERPGGSWKEIGAVLSGYGSKLVTLISPSIRIASKTEPHPVAADGRLPDTRNKPAPLFPLAIPKSPTTEKTNFGLEALPVQTPDGNPLVKITGDIRELDFLGGYTDEQLTDADYAAAATELGCEMNVIRAIETVESGGRSGFDDENRPVILYERHIFSRETNRKHDPTYPDISARKGYKLRPKGTKVTPDKLALNYYSATSGNNYERLARAYQLDKEAALKACSWGKFQILGANYKAVGFASVREMVDAHVKSPRGHLKAFLGFIKSRNLQNAMKQKNWADIAKGYNGAGYRTFNYDERIKAEYEKLCK